MSIEERFQRRLMVLDLYEQGVRVSQCALSTTVEKGASSDGRKGSHAITMEE